MNPGKSFTLTQKQISGLGMLWEGEITSLSPLGIFEGDSNDKELLEDLKRTGVSDDSGKITNGFEDELKTLAKPCSYVSVTFYNENKENTVLRYFSDESSQSVTFLEGDEESLAVGSDLKFSWLLSAYGLDASGGDNLVKYPAINLNSGEAVVFLALCDLEREFLIASQKPDYPADIFSGGFGAELIEAVITRPSLFSGVFYVIAGDAGDISEDLNENIGSLISRGIILDSGTGYNLNKQFQESVAKFITPNAIMDITRMNLGEDGRIIQNKVAGIVSDDCFCSIIKSSDEPGYVLLKWAEKSEAHDLVTGILEEKTFKLGDIMKMSVPDSVKSQEKASEKTEDELSEEILDNNLNVVSEKEQNSVAEQKTVVATKKNFCPECGAPIKEGAKFCSECGFKID